MSRKPFELFRLSTTERNLMAVENANRAIEQDETFYLSEIIRFKTSEIEATLERDALKNPWQPIETCPKDGTRFDVWAVQGGKGERFADCECLENGTISGPYLSRSCTFTHWMKIPEGPK